jgi:hypothetical protein
MYIGYYFPKEYLAKYNSEQGMMHDEDFVQIHDVSSQPEKEAVQHGKPYGEGKNVKRVRTINKQFFMRAKCSKLLSKGRC